MTARSGRLATLRPWLLALAVASLLFMTFTQCDNFRISVYDPNNNTIPTEEFRPEPAETVAAPSCTLPDIVSRLTNSSPMAWIGRPRQGEGSIPDGFTPTGVVRCETNQPDTGPATIDEVALHGDIRTAVAALNTPSLRETDEVSVDCAETPAAPAALWLTSPTGAIRVHWPTTPCGVRDEPLRPLQSLREVGRQTALTLAAPPVQPCDGNFTRLLGRPTRPNDFPIQPVTRRPTMELPDRAVTATTICRYRLTTATTGPDFQFIGSTRLSPAASTQLLRDVTASPTAPPCNQPATQIAAARLLRPDGSGGANFTIEADGCKRMTVSRFTPLLVAPTALIQQASAIGWTQSIERNYRDRTVRSRSALAGQTKDVTAGLDQGNSLSRSVYSCSVGADGDSLSRPRSPGR